MKLKRIVIVGAGLHAEYCIAVIERSMKHDIVGLVDSKKELGTNFLGYPLLGRQEQLELYQKEYDIDGYFIAIGDNWERHQVYIQTQKLVPDLELINAIHPSAIVDERTCLGRGLFIAAGVVISPGCNIGDGCLLGNGVKLGQQNELGGFSSVSVGSVTGGKVKLGEKTAITMGVTVVDRLSVGSNTVVGAGSTVLNGLPDNVLAYGNPARVVRKRQLGERFLG